MKEACGRLEIREASEEDLNDILNLYYRNNKEILDINDINIMIEYDYKKYGKEYKFLSIDNLRKWYREHGKNKIVSAFCNNRLVGFAIFHAGDKMGYIEELHISKEYRRKGIGSKLLEYVEKVLQQRGVNIIFLEAHTNSASFFEKKGYLAINIEEELYMDKLMYIDMVKSFNIDLLGSFRNSIIKFWRGEYREAKEEFEKRVYKNIPNKLRKNIIELWKVIIQAHLEDEETQSYIPLAEKISNKNIDYNTKHKQKTIYFKPLLDMIANKIIADGLISLGLYSDVINRCTQSLEALSELRQLLISYKAYLVEPVARLISYIDSLTHWCTIQVTRSKAVIKNYNKEDRITIGDSSCYTKCFCETNSCPPHEFCTEVLNSINILKNNINANFYKNSLNTDLYIINYFKINNKNINIDNIINRVKSILNSLSIKYIEEGYEISEDIIPLHLRPFITQTRVLSIKNVKIKSLLNNTEYLFSLLLIFYPTNPPIVEIVYKFNNNLTTKDIYILSLLGLPSIIEYEININNVNNLTLNDSNYKNMYYDISPLWLFIKDLFNRTNLEVTLASETLGYVIVQIVSNISAEEKTKVLKDSYIRALLRGYQTVYTSPIEAIGINDENNEENLYAKIGFSDDYFIISSNSSIIVASSIPLWIIKETIAILRLLLLQRAIIFFYFQDLQILINELNIIGLKDSINIVELVEKIRLLKNSLESYASFIRDPTPFRYHEYIALSKTIINILGINELYSMIINYFNNIENSLSLILASMESIELNMLRTFIEQQEKSRALIEYIALLVTILGAGDILWNMLKAFTNPNPLYKLLLYLILLAVGISILAYLRRS